jgi:hypothetical protein
MGVAYDLAYWGCLFCFASVGFLFPYLVGQHYPFKQWTAGEKLAFIILFPLAWFFSFCACWLDQVKQDPIPNNISPQLIELNEIIYPDSNFDFSRLKRGVRKLKTEELETQLEVNKAQLTSLVTNLKNKVNNDAKTVMDLYLQNYTQMIVQNKENDTFAQAQLTTLENALNDQLTQDELATLRKRKKETLVSTQQLSNLQNKNEGHKEPGREFVTSDAPKDAGSRES